MEILLEMCCVILAALFVAEVTVMLDILRERIGEKQCLTETFCVVLMGCGLMMIMISSMGNAVITMMWLLVLSVTCIPEIESRLVPVVLPTVLMSIIVSIWRVITGSIVVGFYTLQNVALEVKYGTGVLPAFSGFLLTSAAIVIIANETIKIVARKNNQLKTL